MAKRANFTAAELQEAKVTQAKQCTFSGNFKLGSKLVKLAQKDVNYEYSSEEGRLYVYIENVRLRTMSSEQRKSFAALTLKHIASILG